MAHIGIIFLLFLLGLNLHPQKLMQLFGQTALVTLASSAAFGGIGYAVAAAWGLPGTDRIVVAIATMFSSTIIGLKLLPATVLHHRHRGEVIISVLLLQDLIAIVALLVLQGLGRRGDGGPRHRLHPARAAPADRAGLPGPPLPGVDPAVPLRPHPGVHLPIGGRLVPGRPPSSPTP